MPKKSLPTYQKKFKKVPRFDPSLSDSVTNKNLAWQVGIIDLKGPWGWEAIDKSLLFEDILPKIQNFESMLWSEVLGRNNHEIPVNKICKEARKRLAELGFDDFDTLVSLRLTGPQRLWGIRIDNILKILWWDPHHEIYPYLKKHT
ncbi:MAG: hypothetical protein ABIK15_18005 [Pseudomonadota bacterium]